MATWHQSKNPVKLYHATQWSVVIDPPNQMRHAVSFSTRQLADAYMRNLKVNNSAVYPHAYILKPAKES